MVVARYLPPKGRDLRLDLFRGVANWAIFLDHIPHNSLNLLTGRNFGFSDAADLFIFISGYTASFVYARIMVERGILVGTTRLIKRVWQIYVAHVLLFVVYLAEIGYLAQKYGNGKFADEFNIRSFLSDPALTLYEGLILQFKPVNMDVLPLYIVLMGLFPPILIAMLKRPNLVLLCSVALYLLARALGWNLPAYPAGHWYFNPFAWQLLFVFGGWFALGGSAESMPFIRSRLFLVLGVAYLIFALVVTLAGSLPELRSLIPETVYSLFSPNDKTNLAPYRIIHFAVIAFFVVRFVPRDWKGLESPLFAPAIVCGQQSLEVFCLGIFLSFAAHFTLVEISGALPMQMLVSLIGIAAMTCVAYYRSWSKRMDKSKPAPRIVPAS